MDDNEESAPDLDHAAEAEDQMAARPQPLVIEVGPAARAALDRRLAKENLNETTILNRAVQLYDRILWAQEDGAEILIRRHVARHGFPWLGRPGYVYERLVWEPGPGVDQ